MTEIKNEQVVNAVATQEVVKPVEKATKTRSAKPTRERTRAPRRSQNVDNEFGEKVIAISRVSKTVKGGRRFSFSAFVVVGDKKGRVGFGHGKANEVPDSIKKAVKDAKNNLITLPILNGTVPHENQAKFLASKVMLKPAAKGTGIVASSTVRAVVELAGYTDVYSKTYGSRSKSNIVRATLKALTQMRTPEQIADIRGKEVKDLLN
ncbi:30S ribosomal protein S5 [Mycoplasmopsis californica HAZ160_1]|uniref:Small ribosomal subunit protein uS5 n=2 Tax=Mycoplasmopsis californica TaxID=2113 RepID=A0A059XWJ5_9BACT|nr:30S ribosomal protein S5 [Mycoplasmopsis californica]BAP00959.1 30S ribosomal protein S5 [Mycoplasmopsis californica HAZ160_1]AIA29602.1 30S ribosomal protein S5 [Mycoplasmopsis californica]BBG40823.1 30S ribosomal protein S5 [Mycoplasmopsis californica]BBG41417.1 30S ribosomal protein S5 [Mycoplasmopsis californica]BBG42010.1 30S ribosomal protein S5 [Mycoplasmopsis californica]